MGEGDIASPPRLQGQGNTHQFRGQGIQGCGFRIHRDPAFFCRRRDPCLQFRLLGDQLIAAMAITIGAGGVLSGRTARRRRGLLGKAVAADFAHHPGDDAVELLGAEKIEELARVGLALGEGAVLNLHRHVILEGHELQRQARLIGKFQEVLAPLGLLNLTGAGQQGFQVPIFIDQLRRGLDADPRNARDIVGGIPGQRLDLHHLVRAHAEFLHHFGVADPAIADRVAHGDAIGIGDQLHHVLVR